MECLFDPTLIGNDGMTLQEAIYYAIQKIDIDKRAVLWDNLCLVGGGSLIKGKFRRDEIFVDFVSI